MGKSQQSRGRANRRYQAKLKDRRRREIPVNWSASHRAWKGATRRYLDVESAIADEFATDDYGPYRRHPVVPYGPHHEG